MKIKAIVLKGQNVKEKDKDILLFSLEEGKIWVKFKGVRGEKAKMKYSKEPFCFGDYFVDDNSKIVTGVDIIEPFEELSKDIDKYFEANGLLEIVNTLNFDSERVPIFINLIKALKILAFHKASQYSVLIKFLIDIFDIYGLQVYSSKCTSCGNDFHDHIFINYSVGELCCKMCEPFIADEIKKGEYQILKLLSQNEYEKLPTIKFSKELGFGLLKILVKNFQYRFEKKLNLIGILDN